MRFSKGEFAYARLALGTMVLFACAGCRSETTSPTPDPGYTTGSIDLTIETHLPTDPNQPSYLIRFGDGREVEAPVNGSITIDSLAPGNLLLTITRVPTNCWVRRSYTIDVLVFAAWSVPVKFEVFCVTIIEGTTTPLPPGVWDAIHWEFFERSDYTHPIEDLIPDGLSGTLWVSAGPDGGAEWTWRETYRWWGPWRPTTFGGHARYQEGLVSSEVAWSESNFECDWGDCNGPLHGENRVLTSGDTLVIAHEGPVMYLNFDSSGDAWSRLTLVRRE